MKKITFILASVIVLVSCGIKNGSISPVINADGMNGVGTISLGMTRTEIINAVKENYQSCNLRLPYGYRRLKTTSHSEVDSSLCLTYNLSEDVAIDINCTFIRDTLVRIKTTTGDGIIYYDKSPETMREAFAYKYGEGIKEEAESKMSELWRSDNAEAEYVRVTEETFLGPFTRAEMTITTTLRNVDEEIRLVKTEARRMNDQKIEAVKHNAYANI